MYKVEAIVRVSRVSAVTDALVALGIDEIVTSDVRGRGTSGPPVCTYRGVRYQVSFIRQVSIVVVADESNVDTIIDTTRGAARSGQPGDGNVFVSPLAEVIDIDAEPAVNRPVPKLAIARRPLLEWAEAASTWSGAQ